MQQSTEDIVYYIKQLTKTSDLNQTKFIEISQTGNGINLLDIVNELRKNKLNFIVSIAQRLSIKEGLLMQSFIVGIKNLTEFHNFRRSLLKTRNFLKIQDARCCVNFLDDDIKLDMVLPPIDLDIKGLDLLPTCIKFIKGNNYQKFLPSEFLIEILQELKIKGALAKLNGVSSRYLTTPRMIDSPVIIRLLSQVDENEITKTLKELGNDDIEILEEKQILTTLEIWSQLYRSSNADNTFAYIMDNNILSRDILSNGLNPSSLFNRLGPKLSKTRD